MLAGAASRGDSKFHFLLLRLAAEAILDDHLMHIRAAPIRDGHLKSDGAAGGSHPLGRIWIGRMARRLAGTAACRRTTADTWRRRARSHIRIPTDPSMRCRSLLPSIGCALTFDFHRCRRRWGWGPSWHGRPSGLHLHVGSGKEEVFGKVFSVPCCFRRCACGLLLLGAAPLAGSHSYES